MSSNVFDLLYASGDQLGGHMHIDGERLDIRSRVHQLPGYSAHADQKGLVDWVRAMEKMPGEIRLVHGEEDGKRL